MANPAEPRLLILETSGRIGQAALAAGETLRAVHRLDEARRHARDLIPAIAGMLAAQQWRPRDLQGVVVSRGPGSYTGLRVGIMTAKTFAYATGSVLLAVDTFAAIALQAPAEARYLDVLTDAQQDKFYTQRFSRTASEVPLGAITPLSISPFTKWLGTLKHGIWVSGPGLAGQAERLPTGTLVVDKAQWDPRPESLLRLGLARYLQEERDDPYALEPLYLRPSSAEEKWQEHQPR